ncbi:Y-family DNA polymerase [bacterium]|nr:Y-family DNA polymerase [bacterium]
MSNAKYIALIDCDSFFCSCERKLNPELNNKPLCVVSSERGCVIARSREAKQMGIKMGDPLFKAVEEHHTCIYMVANHFNYINISKQIMYILKDLSPNVEIYSIDEAFVDVTGLVKLYNKNYFQLAKYIQQKIKDEVNMPVSIGISRSKTLAKLASDRSKTTKEHVILIGKKKIPQYLKDVDVSEIWGIGGRLTIRLQRFGIRTASQFVAMEDDWVKRIFGINGLTTKYELLGSSVIPIINEPPLPKSICDTQSFSEFTSSFDYIKNELQVHIHSACRRLRQINSKCRKIGVIIKTKDFHCYFFDSELETATNFELDISKTAFELLKMMYSPNVLYRSVGILLENFVRTGQEQLSIFDDVEQKTKSENLGIAIDKLENRFGKNIVQVGFTNKEVPNKQGFMTSPKLIY